MIPQGYLDNLRSSFGAGVASVRNSDQRSADQNNTVSGNPNLVNNYTSPLARQQFFQSLAQDPTNIRYQSNYQQQPGPTGYGGQPQAMGRMGMPPMGQPGVTNQQLMQAQQQMQQMPPVNYTAPRGFAGLASQYGAQQQGGGNPQAIFAAMQGMQGGAPGQATGYGGLAAQYGAQQGMPQMNYMAPRAAINALTQGGNGFSPLGGAPGPRNLSAGPSGYRYVRPMVR